MSKARKPHGFPNHVQLSEFIASILPVHPGDVPFTYHAPRNRGYDPVKATVDHVILSITPTSGVYSTLHNVAEQSRCRPACFLHRPFGLDRRALPRGTIILASHKRFDEILTVGYNAVLATKLGLLEDRAVLQGYKQDPERLMGLVALLRDSQSLSSVVDMIRKEFGLCELSADLHEPLSAISGIAIVNAFNPEMIERVSNACRDKAWIENTADLGRILYLTGQARETGLEAAKLVNLPVACVGHRPAEEWGIRWLASRLRAAFPAMKVTEIFEDEEPPAPKREQLAPDEPRRDLFAAAS